MVSFSNLNLLSINKNIGEKLMSQEYNLNPYHNHEDPLNVPVTPLMVEHLRTTKPWVRFISIMMFIATGFMFLAGLAMLFVPSPPGMNSFSFGPVLAIFYFIFGGLYLVPAYFLFQYASYIQDFINGGGDSAMESTLESQKSFWRFIGILTLVIICLYALIFLFAIFGTMSALTSLR
jgi:hypothetical protein